MDGRKAAVKERWQVRKQFREYEENVRQRGIEWEAQSRRSTWRAIGCIVGICLLTIVLLTTFGCLRETDKLGVQARFTEGKYWPIQPGGDGVVWPD